MKWNSFDFRIFSFKKWNKILFVGWIGFDCDKKNEVDYILGLLVKYDIRGKIKKLLVDLNSQIMEHVKVFDESDYKNYLIYISEYILNRVD